MRNSLIVICGITLLGCSPAVSPTAAMIPAPVVYTSGVGEVHVPADLATVTIEFTGRGETPRSAGESASARINDIRVALVGIGIPSDAMPTGRQSRWWSWGGNQARMEIKQHLPDTVRLHQRTDSIWVRPVPRMDTTYVVTQQFTARIREMDLVGPAIDAALDAGAQTITNLSFSRTELREPHMEALELATRYARENAEVMVGEQGARLGRLLDLSTMPLNTQPARGIQLENVVVTARGGSRTTTTIVAPEVRVTATVYARWEVER